MVVVFFIFLTMIINRLCVYIGGFYCYLYMYYQIHVYYNESKQNYICNQIYTNSITLLFLWKLFFSIEQLYESIKPFGLWWKKNANVILNIKDSLSAMIFVCHSVPDRYG